MIAISNDTAVPLGDTIVLMCISFNRPDVSITWIHDSQAVANSSLVYISEELDGLYRQSFLQICATRISNFGSYTCIVSNGVISADASTEITVAGMVLMEKYVLCRQLTTLQVLVTLNWW